MAAPRRHFIIPDRQAKPGVPLHHNRWIGIAIRDYEPDVVVDIGDNADFPSVSTWAAPGSKGKEGQRLQRDIDAANEAEELLAEGMGGFKPKRSEEHTSELQSLMRISYAVLCLKKKN